MPRVSGPPAATRTAPPAAPRRRAGRPALDRGLLGTAVVLAAVTAGFAAVIAVASVVSLPGDAFHPDSERRVAATLSALALVAAGTAAVVTATAHRAGWQLVPVGLLLLFMAVDEWGELHERLEARTGTDWQLLYLPAFAVAGVCFLLAARRHRSTPVFLAPWLAGAACWAVSQVLELAQWDGDEARPGYRTMMVPEEVLELTGTLLFLFAVLALRRRVVTLPQTPVLADRRARRS